MRAGAAGVWSHAARGPFAALGDGSVVLARWDTVWDEEVATGGLFGLQPAPDGEVAWNAIAGPGVAWVPLGVAPDAADRLFVAGSMDPGVNSVLGSTLTCPGVGVCTFIGVLAETGTLAWSKVFSSEMGSENWPQDLAVTGDGRMTVVGGFHGTVDVGCGPLSAGEGIENGSSYLAQLSPSGECLWSRAIVTTHLENSFVDVAVDDAGDVALALPLDAREGAQTLDLGAGPVPFNTDKGPGFAVAKYAPNGDLVFAKVASGAIALPGADSHEASSSGAKVALTGAGEVLFSTAYVGTLDLGGGPKGSPGTVRHFVTKLGANGEELWTRDLAAGGYGRILLNPFSLAATPGGGFFLGGNGRPGMHILGLPTPETTLLVAAYDADGEPAFVGTFPSTGAAFVAGLEVSADGAVVLAGGFTGALDFGQGPLVSEGDMDAFVARICR